MSNAVLEKKTDTFKRAVKAYNSFFFFQKQTPCAQSFVTTPREVAMRSLASVSVIGQIAA